MRIEPKLVRSWSIRVSQASRWRTKNTATGWSTSASSSRARTSWRTAPKAQPAATSAVTVMVSDSPSAPPGCSRRARKASWCW